ncbi:MAG: class I SAM-dependent methyltransferase [Nitrospinales bacterium]
MPRTDENDIRKKILEENRRVHALENRLYLKRHPEQTNFYQARLLNETLDTVDRHLGGREARILELGCGTGYLHLPLLQRGHHVTGVDLSPEMIAVLQQNIPDGQKTRSQLVVMEAETFVEQDENTYDAVVMSALLHHLFDYRAVVKALCAKVKPGGLFLVFFEPLKQEIDAPLRYALHKALANLDEYLYRRKMRALRIPLFEEDYELSDYQRRFGGIDPNLLAETLTQADMRVVETKKYCARRCGASAWIANRILRTSNTFNLLARKTGGE